MHPKYFLATAYPDFLVLEIYLTDPTLSNRKQQLADRNRTLLRGKNSPCAKFWLTVRIVIGVGNFRLFNLSISVFVKSIKQHMPTFGHFTSL
jgi:hypothetical protein